MITTFLTDKDNIVRYDAQSLTKEQQEQARENIGAVSIEEIEDMLGIEEGSSVTGELVQFNANVEPDTELEVISKIHRDETWGESNKLVLYQVNGSNFVDMSSWLGGVGYVIESNGLTATINDDSTITISGTNESTSRTAIISRYRWDGELSARVYPAGTYTIPKGFTMAVRSAQYPRNVAITGIGSLSGTVTIPEPFRVIFMEYGVAAGATVDVTLPLGLFRGSAIPETGYEYSGILHTVTFDTPVYEGKFNWSTGELKDVDGNTVAFYETQPIKKLPGVNCFWTCFGENTVSIAQNDLYPQRGVDYWTEEDITAMYAHIDEAFNGAYERGVQISSGEDLDSYTTVGKYYANANSVASSLANCPTTQNFVMWVFVRTNSAPTQIIIDLQGRMFIRSRSSSKWNAWKTYVHEGNVNDIVLNEIAKYEQLKPVFASSEAECTDQNKLYVLPDGYVYVYQAKKELVANFENKLPSLTDANGNVYNEKGYKYSTRISSSSGTDKTEDGLDYYATGFIPAKLGDVLYLKGMKVGVEDNQHYSHAAYTAIAIYGAEKNYLDFCLAQFLRITEGAFELDENGYVVKIDTAKLLGYEGSNEDLRNPDMEFIRIVCEEITDDSIITVNEPIEYTEQLGGLVLTNTGHAFIPMDYKDRVVDCEENIADLTVKVDANTARLDSIDDIVSALDSDDVSGVPSYWKAHLDERANDIRLAMESAGRNKSSFLWYNDAHWNYGSQISPKLLHYLYQHTPINKVNFGGDIVNNEPTDLSDRETMKYLWKWRDMTRELPNHHSVIGNHDDGNTTNNLFPDSYIYAFLLAPEENNDIVLGDGFYYYMDDKSEKTRYLYLDTAYENFANISDAQLAFVKDAIKTTPENWHIVAMAHIWHDNDYTVKPPVVSSLSKAAVKLLAMFDEYNARSGEYSECGGKVEFCIGGHCHVDNDSRSDGGIPIILTETDSMHVRSGLTYTAGTITEASVNGIIADYDHNKIHVVRVGRGASREVEIKWYEVSYTNVLPLATTNDGTTIYNGIGYKESTRWSASGNTEQTSDTYAGVYLTGYIPVTAGDVIRLKNITMPNTNGNSCMIHMFKTLDDTNEHNQNNISIADNYSGVWDDGGNLVEFTFPGTSAIKFIRIQCGGITDESIITINEAIE